MKQSIKLSRCIPVIDELDINKLPTVFKHVTYVNQYADERVTGLIMFELEQMLDNMSFSPRINNDKIIKLIIYLHCLGYTDKEIANGLNKLRTKQVSHKAIEKVRNRAVGVMMNKYGRDVGIITILYEAFGELEEMSPKMP